MQSRQASAVAIYQILNSSKMFGKKFRFNIMATVTMNEK